MKIKANMPPSILRRLLSIRRSPGISKTKPRKEKSPAGLVFAS